MNSLININGELFPPENAQISIFDRGFLFGDSVYEVTRTYKGHPLLLEEHMDRLWRSASMIGMEMGFTREELKAQISQTIEKLNPDTHIYIRIVVTRGVGEVNLDPDMAEGKNNLVIIAKEKEENPSWWYEKGVHALIANIERTSKENLDPGIKSGNYLNNLLALSQAKKANCFEAIMLNKEGFVAEGTTSNIWMVKDGQLITPPLKAGLLEGITRKTLIHIAKKEKLPIVEENILPSELLAADEAFLTSSTKELVPIVKIDDQTIGSGTPGDSFKKIHKLYKEFVLLR
jgi:branched-chain amino acid aminotransferase